SHSRRRYRPVPRWWAERQGRRRQRCRAWARSPVMLMLQSRFADQGGRGEGKMSEDFLGADVVHDEDEPAAVIGIRPIVEPFRREHRMLSGLYDSWAPGPVGELDNALDAQEIVAAITRQPAERAGKIEPGRRLVQLPCEDADAVAVRMLARGKPPPVLGSAA